MVRPVTVATGRHPFELAFLFAATAVGVLLLVTGHRPRSAETMPHWVQVVWPPALVVGGVVALAGLWWRPLERGLWIERVGVILLGGALSLYTVALIRYSGMGAAAPAGFTGAFGLGSWWRAMQVGRDLGRLHAARTGARVESVPLLVEE